MRVLIADDDRVSRLAVEDLFPPADLVGVDSGAAAWAALRDDPRFDLVCLDVRMPAPDGLELAQRIRGTPELEQLPVVLITSAADRDTVMTATRAQVQGLIVKPVNEEARSRLQRVMLAFDATVLEPAAMALARLGVDAERYARYLDAFVQQLHGLAQQAAELAQDGPALTFQHKCGVCRNAAVALGARRIERLISDAMRASTEAPQRSERLLRLAAYWVERVRASRRAGA